MRVSMSEIGSLMLMQFSPAYRRLPARLDDARDLAAHGDLAQLVAREAELAKSAARTSRQGTAVPHPDRRRIARQLLQLEPRLIALFLTDFGIVRDREQLGALGRVFRHRLAALLVPVDQCQLCHGYVSS